MKKMLITITTVGVLAVPAGMALAQSDPVEPDTPVPTCVDHERDRDRDRSGDHDMLGTHDQVRTQLRTQLHDGDCDADCTGDHAQTQARARTQEQIRLDDGTGPGARNRVAEMGNADNG
jgi:Ni/Co efflux regulator RcnB